MDEEKVVYQDDQVKLTDMRLTCNHVTIPIAKIDHVRTNLRVNNLSMAFVLFLLSFVFFYWYDHVLCVLAGVVMAVGTLVWMISIYNSYVELWVNVNMRKIKVLDTNLGNRSYIFKIADEIAKTLIIDKKLEERHKEMAQKGDGGGFTPSETMKLRMLLKEMDKDAGTGISFEDQDKKEDDKKEDDKKEDDKKEDDKKEDDKKEDDKKEDDKKD